MDEAVALAGKSALGNCAPPPETAGRVCFEAADDSTGGDAKADRTVSAPLGPGGVSEVVRVAAGRVERA